MSAEVAAADNVLRFPTERRARPTLDLSRELAPHAREVAAIVAAFNLALARPNVRADADARAANYIRARLAGHATMTPGA